ncbi:hypothetical protein B0J14DRAFT_654392 [Halenospora varia]|nr:hypothetical protein B0J14DRAFT_654392 [Halenospora varia]
MPPKSWNPRELQRAGAVASGPTRPPSLTNQPHKLFHREAWRGITDSQYNTLLPSMRLASYFIEAAIPHIASFLPTDQIFEYLGEEGDPVITKKKEFRVRELLATKAELEGLADSIHWEIDYDMYETRGVWGINIKTSQQKPWIQEDYSMIAESDRALKGQGATRRHLTLGVAGQYVDTIRNNARNSEVHLRAVWHAAVTLAHEVGNAIFCQDFRWNSIDGAEPWVGDMCLAELGLAMMDFVFSGYNPDTMNTGSLAALFLRPLVWRKERKVAALEKERPLYERFYAINNDYMEATFTQSFWDEIEKSASHGIVKNSRTRLRPRINEHSAYADFPDFEYFMDMAMYDEDEAPVEWKVSKHPDRSPMPNTLDDLTPEEIAYAVRLHEQEESQQGRKPAHTLDEDDDEYWDDNDDEDDDEESHALKGKSKVLSSSTKSNPHSGGGPIHLELHGPERGIDQTRDDEFVEPVVKYRPAATEGGVANLGKRLRMDNGNKHGRHSKNSRGKKKIHKEDDEEDEVIAILVKTSAPSIESQFTRRQADAYCKKHKIKAYRDTGFSQDWAAEHPSTKYAVDKDVILRIRRHMLEEQAKRFKGDVDAVNTFRRAIAESVWDWCIEDILDFCRLQGLPFTGNEQGSELYEQVRQWYQMDINGRRPTRGARKGSTRVSNARGKRIENDPVLGHWDEKEFKIFFLSQGLPTWGDIRVYRERYNAWKYEQKHGQTRPRNLPLDRSGTEVYRLYGSKLNAVTIGMLKEALYLKGSFPSSSILRLNTEPPMATFPVDDQPLSSVHFGPGKPKTLILRVEGHHVKEEPPSDGDREPKPVIWNAKERAYATMKASSKAKKTLSSIVDLTGSTNPKSKPTRGTRASTTTKTKPTYSNVLSNVSSQANMLMGIRDQGRVGTGSGGGLFKHGSSRTPQPSAQQMLNAIEAIQQRQTVTDFFDLTGADDGPRGSKRKRTSNGKGKENEQAVIDLTGNNGGEDGDDEDDEVSHMAVVAKQVKKRRGPMGNTRPPHFPGPHFS